MRYAQLVVGPAGSGKSTYCATIVRHASVIKRRIDVVNLDPAAEKFNYEPIIDIRDLIQLDDVMEDNELKFGPNGGLVFCLEFLLENMEWMNEQLQQELDDDYILFDCPGQIELYTHLDVMRKFIDALQAWNFRVCAVFMIDSHFMVDGAKFLSGAMAALSVMVNLEIPHVNILSKVDLLDKTGKKQLNRFLEPNSLDLCYDQQTAACGFSERYEKLTMALGRVFDDYSLVKFYPLNIYSARNIGDLLFLIDSTIQYGEDGDVKTVDFVDAEQINPTDEPNN